MKVYVIYMCMLFLFICINTQAQNIKDIFTEEKSLVTTKPTNNAVIKNIKAYFNDEDKLCKFTTQEIEQKLEPALQALGFYHSKYVIKNSTHSPCLSIHVTLNEPVVWGKVHISLEGDLKELLIYKKQRLKFYDGNNQIEQLFGRIQPNKPISHKDYEDIKAQIEDWGIRYGFFSGSFLQHEFNIDLDKKQADIDLAYHSGLRYKFGSVNFIDPPFEQSLLERMKAFTDGDDYSSELVEDFYQNLQSSNYFSSIIIDNIVDDETALVNLNVILRKRKPRTWNFGVGYSTDVGVRARTSLTRYWVNPQGHSYSIDLYYSNLEQGVGVWYEIPGNNPIKDKYRFVSYLNKHVDNKDTYLSQMVNLGPEIITTIGSGWNRTISLKTRHERYRIGDDRGFSNIYLFPHIGFSKIYADNLTNANRGYHINIDWMATAKPVADINLSHVTFNIKGLDTYFNKHRLLLRAGFGVNLTNKNNAVPPSLRFFAGGDQSVRGFRYQSISPQNSNGDRVGGRYMGTASAEYQYSITSDWRIALFSDIGNSINDLEKISLKKSIGTGIRWRSPVGVLRLDFGQAIGEDKDWQLHFSMGPEL